MELSSALEQDDGGDGERRSWTPRWISSLDLLTRTKVKHGVGVPLVNPRLGKLLRCSVKHCLAHGLQGVVCLYLASHHQALSLGEGCAQDGSVQEWKTTGQAGAGGWLLKEGRRTVLLLHKCRRH